MDRLTEEVKLETLVRREHPNGKNSPEINATLHDPVQAAFTTQVKNVFSKTQDPRPSEAPLVDS